METTNTTLRDTGVGIVATRGNRTIHLISKTDTQKDWSLGLFDKHSFDRVYKAAKRAPGGYRHERNTRVIYAADYAA